MNLGSSRIIDLDKQETQLLRRHWRTLEPSSKETRRTDECRGHWRTPTLHEELVEQDRLLEALANTEPT